jgi:hypothetical protein
MKIDFIKRSVFAVAAKALVDVHEGIFDDCEQLLKEQSIAMKELKQSATQQQARSAVEVLMMIMIIMSIINMMNMLMPVN